MKTAASSQLHRDPGRRALSGAILAASLLAVTGASATQAAEPVPPGDPTWTMPPATGPTTASARPTPRLATTPPSPHASAPAAMADPDPADPVPAEPAPADEITPDDEPSPPFIDLMVGAHVPLAVVGGGSIELPGRLLAQLDVGGVPAFAGTVGGSLIEAVGIDDPNIALAAGAFGGAVLARVSAGWRPFPKAGFEVTGGYTFLSLSGSVSPQDVTKVAPGGYASEVTSKLKEDLTISSQLHNIHVGLGWRWIAADHIVIRAGLGYTQCVAASSAVAIPDDPKAEGLANDRVDAVTSEIYLTYFKLPVVSLSAGYRF